MTLRSMGLVVHGGKTVAVRVAESMRSWAADRGITIVDLDVWSDDRHRADDEVREAGSLDLIVTIGGDGTFLRGVPAAAAADAPILGVDVGRVGFLTEVLPEDLIVALEAFESGHTSEEQRLTLTVRASGPLDIPHGLDSLLAFGRGPALPPPTVMPRDDEEIGWGVPLDITALNDVVFEKLSRDRQASLGVYVGDRLFVSYSADALVVATPTGSTAYSFSAGGPVISPRARVLLFTPVAAHMVFDRSLIIGADEVISVRVLPHSGPVVMSVDGQIRGVLQPGDWVATFAKQKDLRLVRFTPPDFFGRLKSRFELHDARAASADGALPERYVPRSPKPRDLGHLNVPTTE
jgi:NAD+ kinase